MKFSQNNVRELRLPGRTHRPGQQIKDFRFAFWKSGQNSSRKKWDFSDVYIYICLSVRCAHFDVSDAIVACALLHVRSLMWQDIMEYTSTVKLHLIMRHVQKIFSWSGKKKFRPNFFFGPRTKISWFCDIFFFGRQKIFLGPRKKFLLGAVFRIRHGGLCGLLTASARYIEPRWRCVYAYLCVLKLSSSPGIHAS